MREDKSVALSSSAASHAHHRLACAFHGMLSPQESAACGICGRQPYDLDDPDEFHMIQSLRRVAKQTRMAWATMIAGAICTVTTVIVDAALGRNLFGVAPRIFVVAISAPLVGIPLERVFRLFQPKALRQVDVIVFHDFKAKNAPRLTAENR